MRGASARFGVITEAGARVVVGAMSEFVRGDQVKAFERGYVVDLFVSIF
jgi:hypothetical protein